MTLVGICQRCGQTYFKLNPYRSSLCIPCKVERMEESAVKSKENRKLKNQLKKLDKSVVK